MRAAQGCDTAVVALVPYDRDDRAPAVESAALAHVRDEPVLVHTLRGLLGSGVVDRVVLAVPPADSPDHSAYAGCVAALESAGTRLAQVHCGAGRTHAVRSAFAAHLLDDADVVLVHDSTRPFVPPSVLRSVAAAVRAGAPAVVPVEAVTDTIKVVADGTIRSTHDRSGLRSVQSPHGFSAAELRRRVAADGPGLDDAVSDATTVAGHPHAVRLSTPFDITVAEALLADEQHQAGGHQ
ncbi:2-C-methyl-D-erythritol 4-phosphate cytidylyltransferase [Amycolatopsis marina]|uniref:2-C-methyl-D-erythritol 4-phosphate cytidylyltransferase n=1 Tax=Amycolatopsis marina TaxID=490629 RepID=A0A1I0Y3J6_9PSEU|nr:2-C-methyl-D-erythritol 4-phosphate cytidylyltransferase [Amycolatopsis marina]SFB07744.1 2-C-methyl-D-erythritol 4-phosphate cytidylyltransferase [Amycolatopsis marina]